MANLTEKQPPGPDVLLEIFRMLSLNEARIFLVCLFMAGMQLRNYHALRNVLIPAKELIGMFGNNKAYYSEIANVTDRLREKALVVNSCRLQIFSEIGFAAERGGLVMRFNSELTPLLAPIASRGYIDVLLRISFAIKSIYALRLLIILLGAREQHMTGDSVRLAIRLNDMRYCLAIPNTSTYQQITNVKNKVLNRPISDINTSGTGFHIAYDVMKEGHRVAGFVFTMEKCG